MTQVARSYPTETKPSISPLKSLTARDKIEVVLLTGGGDKPYAFGLAMALISKGVVVDFIGSDDVDAPELHTSPNLRFLNLQGNQRQDASLATKILRITTFYARLLRYAAVARPKIFHILWNNKFQLFDRTLLTLYYKLLGRKVVFTAHNVNTAKRDLNDSFINRLTLRIQYQLVDHIFVHTEQMKAELLQEFGVSEQTVTVIPFGINNCAPHTNLTPAEAKHGLAIGRGEKTILFFGQIGPYKGLEVLIQAFQLLSSTNSEYRLLIAGKIMTGCQEYQQTIQQMIRRESIENRIIQRMEFIPDEQTEIYFKAADLLVLPYTRVSQSGVLFLGYSFGLPVVATDVGSFRENIVDGGTGFVSKAGDPIDLANAIRRFFESDLFKNLDSQRPKIQEYAKARNSWDVVGDKIVEAYAGLGAFHYRKS